MDDMKMHGMLHAALVVSSRPHAKIISIDASGAVLVCPPSLPFYTHHTPSFPSPQDSCLNITNRLNTLLSQILVVTRACELLSLACDTQSDAQWQL